MEFSFQQSSILYFFHDYKMQLVPFWDFYDSILYSEIFRKTMVLCVFFQLIGRSMGQLFKKEVKIHDLPRIVVTKKPENEDVITNLRNVFS